MGASPRTRNAAATRAAILGAARARFSREAYDSVGVRDVASDAGVDPALISRYFGSKEDLFVEVCNTGDPSDLFDVERDQFGAHVAHMMLHEPQDSEKLDCFLIMLRSSASPKASEAIRVMGRDRFYDRLDAYIGGDSARVCARIVGAIIMGLSISRALVADFDLDEAQLTDMERRLADIIQRCID
ncbi:TetR family transcriptional regulator [Caulobacter segnis]|uniref:TetR/AcrR family transcriptional regulator n=1 Tax=Caulobacter segnis TaxID=88688 RepID=UPI00240ED6EF|nr:TetR/AcrR family transcriptional regulator [Caulobacter segnis]MDG2522867.1 TetR family transcriptional regulator [Caulobacter segnis]